MTDSIICTGFEPQNYLRDRCKKCFRLKSKHDETPAQLLPERPKRDTVLRRKSWRDHEREDDDAVDLVSVSSYTSATSKGTTPVSNMSSAKSIESITDTRSMVTAVSGSEERAPTPSENDPSLMISIADELALLREENKKLKEERERWTVRSKLNGTEDETLTKMLEERLNEAESCIQDYRDENTVLKCELRELQESSYSGTEVKLSEKLKTTETLCEELMEENESLKAEVKDLQTEIEEMQDQYREEEIEEFRELQRELEQHAKNSRVLQFKLRKSERAREQAESEKTHLTSKLETMNKDEEDGTARTDDTRMREIEAELKIAKEVSVRLHGELEQTEEKRYRLEDEVFYLKEKIREIQTQNKWREARNKTETAVKRLSAELASSAPLLPSDDMSKELRDAVEREIDTREQLKYAEEDLKRTQLRLQDVENENEILLKKLNKLNGKLRPPMVRSASEGNAHIQLELAEHEVEHLSTKIERLEKTKDHLTKKIIELESDSTKRVDRVDPVPSPSYDNRFKLTPEMERDMANLIATIADLEKRNRELMMQVKKGDEIRKITEPDDPSSGGSTIVSGDLKSEQEKRRTLEIELNEMKQTLLKTDNQKLIAMATKVEILNNQLGLANERCNNLHKKYAKEGETTKYVDELKTRVESLEKELSEKRASSTISELQGKVPTNDEIEECCMVLATVEARTSRICKQIEKLDTSQKDERRRSLSKDCGATIIADLANVMEELKNVHKLLDSHKLGSTGSNTGTIRRSPFRDNLSPFGAADCKKCKENEEYNEQQRNEIIFYKKKNKDLTEQVLQTEDRWTIEIEKQRQIFENEIKTLGVKLADARRNGDEQAQLIAARTSALTEKTRALEEQEDRNRKLQTELKEKQREMMESESDKKNVREYEIKYKKLESIFDQERQKMNSERARNKNEMTALKKATDDAVETRDKAVEELAKKEHTWKIEKASQDREISSLKKQLHAARNEECSFDEESRSTSYSKSDKQEPSLSRQDSERLLNIELKKQIAQHEKKNADLAAELENVKIENVDLRTELNKSQAAWTKEKEAFQHKARQTEKIRSVEMDALQQKFSSRMRIMEDTNKSLHSQLVLARRARDQHKEAVTSYEGRLTEEKRISDSNEKKFVEASEKLKALTKKLNEMEAALERTQTELRLTKEAKKADQILWNMEKDKKGKTATTNGTAANDIKTPEGLRQQYQEYEKFYQKEVERLNNKVRELNVETTNRQNEAQRTIRELREQVRVLEIEKRNLSQTRDYQFNLKENMEAEQQRLQQAVHLSELHKLTRKYRLSSIIDQLQYVCDPIRKAMEIDQPESIRYIISQLAALRDEDAHNGNNDERSLMEKASECDGTYDNISQSSLSIRSSIRGLGWSNQTSSVSYSTHQPLTQVPRSMSTDEFQRSRSPRKVSYPDPPPNFLINGFPVDKDTVVEYDKDGRLHYVPKALARSASFDKKAAPIAEPEDTHFRANSAGSHILYKVRREELARGGHPSVRLMAKAFESFDDKPKKKGGFFGVRKSQSVDTQGSSDNGSMSTTRSLLTNDEMSTATLPRGGRNPFKNMGTKIVERVRRSLSRSSRGERRESEDTLDDIPIGKIPKVEKAVEKSASSPKKTKKKAAENKARKTTALTGITAVVDDVR